VYGAVPPVTLPNVNDPLLCPQLASTGVMAIAVGEQNVFTIVWEAVATFPHASVAVHVRVMVRLHPLPVGAPSTKLAESPEEQLSVTVGAVTAASICAWMGLHGNSPIGPNVITGGVLSTNVNV
jgi:hypothetical protein